MHWCFGCCWQVAFPPSRAALCLLQGETRACAVCGWNPEVSLAVTLLSCCRKVLVAAAWPAGQDGPGSVGDTLCPCVQTAMAGLSPGLFSLRMLEEASED